MSVLAETTTDFVLATRDRVVLALEVEGAMTAVRRKLAFAFIDALETRLRAAIGGLPGNGWSVIAAAPAGWDMMAGGAYVALRRKDWPVLPAEGTEGDFHCVCVSAYKANWVEPWLGIHSCRSEAELAARLKDAAVEAIGPCLGDDETAAYRWLEAPLHDWRQRAFLLDAGYPALRRGAAASAVRDVAEQMLALARAVTPIYRAHARTGKPPLRGDDAASTP